MFAPRNPGKQLQSPYATREVFCRLFESEMDRLYRLSLLLTGEDAAAERCFIESLHTAQAANAIFEEWADAWARRTIILNAIRAIGPRLTLETSGPFGRVTEDPATQRPEIAAILKLHAFERFVFVMSVLEGYSDHECALHLGCTRADVTAARIRALEQIGRSAGLDRPSGEAGGYLIGPQRTGEHSKSQAQLVASSDEAVSRGSRGSHR